MKPLNVLSIDWDYLVDATDEERATLFPDIGNEDASPVLSDLIWASRYSYEEELPKIKVDKNALRYLEKFIKMGCNKDTKLIVMDSHKHLYYFVKNLYEYPQPIQVINLDFHHDCYGNPENEKIHCGNWVLQLFLNSKNRIDPIFAIPKQRLIWVKRPDSEKLPLRYTFNWIDEMYLKDLKEFEEQPIDILYICRSGMWSPPHLDKQFINFVNLCESQVSVDNVSKQSEIMKTRYTKRFQKEYETLKIFKGNHYFG